MTGQPSSEPKALLLTRDSKTEADWQRQRLAASLVRLNLAQTYGVFVAPIQGAWGVFIGKHDGSAVEPDLRAIRARDQLRQHPAQSEGSRTA